MNVLFKQMQEVEHAICSLHFISFWPENFHSNKFKVQVKLSGSCYTVSCGRQ